MSKALAILKEISINRFTKWTEAFGDSYYLAQKDILFWGKL
jgi:hypothetical protein